MHPPGQKFRSDFPRFGLPLYADRFPSKLHSRRIDVDINNNGVFEFDVGSNDMPRSTIKADFHCVTTWSYAGVNWAGIRLVDLYEKYVQPLEKTDGPIVGAIFHAQDGYKTTLMLEDLLNDQVMLADTLNSQPLSIEHGAPVRLVMPEHYGYKNLKHLKKIEFHANMPVLKRGLRAFMDHPRARVSKEERARWLPGWLLRSIYRSLIPATIRQFGTAMKTYKDDGN